jgi:DNA-binding CsgD family transcriptional regulator
VRKYHRSPTSNRGSRRTVQTYISHILTKLGAKSRVEIVREAMRQGFTP